MERMERARRRIPLAALALAAPLMLSSSTTGSDAGTAPERAQAALACEAPATAIFDRSIEAAIARRAARVEEPAADADIVVLNGRGYNYGAAEPDRLDRVQLEALMTRIELERR